MRILLPSRAVVAAVGFGFGVVAQLAHGQAAGDANSPKLDQPFTFTLSPHRDEAVTATTKAIEQHDDLLRRQELAAVNAPVLSKALELLRYVPIKLGASDGEDDFFTPSYLRRDYARLPAETHLFDTR